MRKSLGLLGLGEEAALKIALDADLRMDLNDLERVLNQLDHNDLLLAVVGVYGSTEEGAIDDFEALDQLREKREKAGLGSFWLHADACYGGYALSLLAQNDSACEKEPKSEAEMEPAAALQTFLQSVAKQPRPAATKGILGLEPLSLSALAERLTGFVSGRLHLTRSAQTGLFALSCGSVAYRDYRSREFIRCEAPYLNSETVSETPDLNTPYPGKYTLEGSRPGATSAAIWLAHQTVPLNRQGHGRLVAGTVVSTVYLQEVLKAVIAQELTGIHCVFLSPEPDLNILCYGFTGSWQGQPLSLKESNLLVEELYQRLLARELQPQQTQDFIVSMTRLERGTYSKSQLKLLAPSFRRSLGQLGSRKRTGFHPHSGDGSLLNRSRHPRRFPVPHSLPVSALCPDPEPTNQTNLGPFEVLESERRPDSAWIEGLPVLKYG